MTVVVIKNLKPHPNSFGKRLNVRSDHLQVLDIANQIMWDPLEMREKGLDFPVIEQALGTVVIESHGVEIAETKARLL